MNTEDDTIDALRNPPTEDEIAFGRNAWIYCDQHMRPHMTGWCSVSSHHKKPLENKTEIEAYAECKVKNYKIYNISRERD